MHSIRYIPTGLDNRWLWAVSLNEGQIDGLWKEIEEKYALNGKPVKSAELHGGGILMGGQVKGSKVIVRLEIASIAYVPVGDAGVCEYYTATKSEIDAAWTAYKKTTMILGQQVRTASLLKGGEIKPNGFVSGAQVVETFPKRA